MISHPATQHLIAASRLIGQPPLANTPADDTHADPVLNAICALNHVALLLNPELPTNQLPPLPTSRPIPDHTIIRQMFHRHTQDLACAITISSDRSQPDTLHCAELYGDTTHVPCAPCPLLSDAAGPGTKRHLPRLHHSDQPPASRPESPEHAGKTAQAHISQALAVILADASIAAGVKARAMSALYHTTLQLMDLLGQRKPRSINGQKQLREFAAAARNATGAVLFTATLENVNPATAPRQTPA